MPIESEKQTNRGCNYLPIEVSLSRGETNLENEISAQTTVANLRNITTRNGCTATLLFSEKDNSHIRREVAELLLRSVQKRSEAT